MINEKGRRVLVFRKLNPLKHPKLTLAEQPKIFLQDYHNEKITCLVVGSEKVGKSCFGKRLGKGKFDEKYNETLGNL